ncbi:MAG TPA: hypothetical protein VMT75_08935 [Candidatus Saccharimonadales bacterium]|nr:hypothetical protein [Candidatus Saccharimonadales bacterium]
MKLKTTPILGILLFATLPSLAQLQDSSSNAKPAPADANAPANPAPEKKKPKKVWTNDELPKTGGGLSVVGDSNAPNGDTGKAPETSDAKQDARHRQIDNYKGQLSRLQSQIDAIDKRIDQLKNFKGENTSPSGGININQGYNMVPIPDQIKQLEDKKKELRAKMDDVETEAHRNGITADDLR